MPTSLKKALLVNLTLALALCTLFACLEQVKPAYAATDNIEETLTELQEQIEQSAKEYDEAVAIVESLEKQIEDTEKKINEIEKTLPSQQAKSDEATVALYKMQQEGYSLIDLLLNAGSLEEFIDSMEFFNRIQEENLAEMSRLTEMKIELEAAKTDLEKDKIEADAAKSNAEEALRIAKEKREEIQRQALEEARVQEEATRAATQQEQAAEETPSNPSISTETPSGSPNEIDWSTDPTAFVDEWTVRIDNYLAGSPLSGQGRNFAEAAWNYGVDPRWSPAISNTESTKGTYCFRPYNAWGWGQISWGSWGEAIDAHVRGLARGYGYTISVAHAQKYCPPNWEHWYNSTLSQMNMI